MAASVEALSPPPGPLARADLPLQGEVVSGPLLALIFASRRHYRRNDPPSDRHFAVAAPHRNRQRRLHGSIAGHRGIRGGERMEIAGGPNHHTAADGEVAKVDPRRATRIAVDQGARVIRG